MASTWQCNHRIYTPERTGRRLESERIRTLITRPVVLLTTDPLVHLPLLQFIMEKRLHADWLLHVTSLPLRMYTVYTHRLCGWLYDRAVYWELWTTHVAVHWRAWPWPCLHTPCTSISTATAPSKRGHESSPHRRPKVLPKHNLTEPSAL